MAFDHKWYKVRRNTVQIAPGKVIDDYFLGVFPNIALIVAITKNNKIVMVRQYKAGANSITLEVPAGYIDGKETPLHAAKRELLEETGYHATKWTKLGFFYGNPTKEQGNGIHIFLATGAQRVTEQNLDENESIAIKVISLKEALNKIATNEINVAGSAAAILMASRKLEKPR